MKAAIYNGPGLISVEDIEKPKYKDNEYLVRVIYSGLCGTDVKTYKQGHRFFTPPCILGHEFSGIIEAAGKDMDKGMINKKITCAPYVSCNSCNQCDKGLYELCINKDGISSGTFAQYITIPAETVRKGMVVLNDHTEMKEISLSEPLACVLNSVNKMEFHAGDDVLIMGAGPMGLIHVEVLRKFGANRIFVSEYNEGRLKIAESLGAIPINPGKQSVKDTILKETNGKGVEEIVVAIGIPKAVEEACEYAADGTVVNIFGGLANGSKITIDPNILHYHEVKLTGSFGFSPINFKTAARLIETGRISLKNIITHEFEIDDIETAFKKSISQEVVKAVIKL